MEECQLRHLRPKIATEGKVAKLATLPKEEEYQNLDIRRVWKIANFANSLSAAIFRVQTENTRRDPSIMIYDRVAAELVA
jgi:hypothetical protein